MSTEPCESTAEVTERSSQLRLELKEWEKSFAAANDGRKAGRDDIKQNPSIAFKYKEYTKLRDVLAGKSQPPPVVSRKTHSKKRKASATIDDEPSSHENGTPRKRHADAVTPSRTPLPHHPHHPADIDPYDSTSTVRKLQFTPSRRAVIGPTPQKDGKILGLFDLLSDNEDAENTPVLTPSKTALLHATPRNKAAAAAAHTTFSVSNQCTPQRHSRTPASSSRRFLLAEFATTPLKNKHRRSSHSDDGSPSHSSSSTPAFLRRRGAAMIPTATDEDGNPTYPSPDTRHRRRPARPPVRGLSSILAGLRKMEDDRLDEELDILREIEGNGDGGGGGAREGEQIVVNDSQAGGNEEAERTGPGGAHADEVDDDDDDGGGKDQRSSTTATGTEDRKPWKKRGQKRNTRRVILRPVPSKPPPPPPPPPPARREQEQETQPCAPSPSSRTDPPCPTTTTTTSKTKTKTNPPTSTTTNVKKTKVIKKQPQNYRRLKLGPGRGGGGAGAGGKRRFGKGRRR